MFFLFITSIFTVGIILTKFLFKSYRTLCFWAFSFLLGSLFSVSLIFVLANIFSFVNNPLPLSLVIYLILTLILGVKNRYFLTKLPHILEKEELLFLLLSFLFSFYIFLRSFFYDTVNNSILVASNLYLDFGSHIPLIRSFSFGNNFPTSLPFFGNQPLFYHYLFDFYAGVLEFLGVRLDWALNLISIFSFVSLLLLLYSLSISLFKNKWAGFLSLLFFLFNGTLNFIVFLQKFGVENITNKIRNYNMYLEGTTFGENPVSIFWNLNTFLNQRHLIFGAAFFLLMIYWYVEKNSNKDKRSWIIWGILIGLLPFWHGQVFIAAVALAIGCFVILWLEQRIHKKNFIDSRFRGNDKEDKRSNKYYTGLFWLLLALSIVSLPQLWLIKSTTAANIVFRPGFLLADNFTLQNFLTYWIYNLGFYLPVLIAVFFVTDGIARKLFSISFILFLFSNLFQVGPEMFNNHKFFNLWMMLQNIFAGYLVVRIWDKKLLKKVTAVFLIMVLTASGFLDFFVMKNDVWAKFPDYPKDKLLSWVVKNTNKTDLFLTNGDIYDPVTLVGRKTFLGRTHFIWAYGGDPDKRIKEENLIFLASDEYETKRLLLNYSISYVVIYTESLGIETKKLFINKDFFLKNFRKVYEDNKTMVFKI